MEPVVVLGVGVDAQSRCAHWHSELDIVANRFACCDRFYACRQCHDELAGHEAVPWPSWRFGEPAVRCGACGHLMTPPEYFDADDWCPECGADFNPGCRAHRELYFS